MVTDQVGISASSKKLFLPSQSQSPLWSCLLILSILTICTAIGMQKNLHLDHENVIMLYLLGITYIATRTSLLFAVIACFLSVLSFSFFIVPPVFSITPEDPHYAFTFAIMFVVALVMSQLINKQKTANQLLQQQTELLNLTSDAIMAWDGKSKAIIFWNSGAVKMFGINDDDAIGKNIHDLLKGKYPDLLDNLIVTAGASGSWHGEIKYTTRDNTEITVESRWTSKSTAGGTHTTIVEFATDISERKLAEKRVREFYSTVSHELRTPLTLIRGPLELLSSGIVPADSEEGVEMFTLARTQCITMTALINDMLDLQKMEAGMLELNLCPTKISDIINRVVGEIEKAATAKEVKLRADLSKDATLDVDAMRIGQVLTNIVINAIKFSPPGSSVVVTATVKDKTVRVEVQDGGPGIEASQMSKLFEKFQQLDSSDTRSHGGTGLGLAISKAIVEQHQGKIGVESEPGQGSKFWFELQRQD